MSLDSELKTILDYTLLVSDLDKSTETKTRSLREAADRLASYFVYKTESDFQRPSYVHHPQTEQCIGSMLTLLASIADDLGLSLSDCLTEWSQNYRRVKDGL